MMNIPTQGDVALEVGSGAHVVPEWVKRVKSIYNSSTVNFKCLIPPR